MHETGEKLLKLMFKPGETICVSPDQYGYHSILLENVFAPEITILSTSFRDGIKQKDGSIYMPTPEEALKTFPTETLRLVALNPIKGWRLDENCTAYRNFLVEMDIGPLSQQLSYIEKMEMPYSAAVFSGGKSLHFLISLDRDLPDQKTWRLIAEWILKICTAADQMTKNPSRSIRIPGPKRDESRQILARFKGPVAFSDLRKWLERHPDAKPKPRVKKVPSGKFNFDKLSPWVLKRLIEGLDPTKGRSNQWYAIGYEFSLCGYSEDSTIEILSEYFNEDHDFKEKEWLTCIRSAFEHVHGKR